MAPVVNLLEYLRSKTQVDCDSLDLQVLTDLGPFTDCTSNQADAYLELVEPHRAPLLRKSATLARQLLADFPSMTFEELAFEVSMVNLSLLVVPKIPGSIHIMANPLYAYSTMKIIENGQRIARLCRHLQPGFDMSRLCIKVPSTWEGLQACRKLKGLGIRTLATTLFTIEQAILAAEVGVVSISPFVHELKVHFDSEYHDKDPIFDLCVKAQRYYEQHSYSTRVKACSLISVDEVMQLAGVFALTLPPNLLQELADNHEPEAKVVERSMFANNQEKIEQAEELASFMNDEAKYRAAFSRRDNGKGQMKTIQAIELFAEFQIKAEALMRDADPART